MNSVEGLCQLKLIGKSNVDKYIKKVMALSISRSVDTSWGTVTERDAFYHELQKYTLEKRDRF